MHRPYSLRTLMFVSQPGIVMYSTSTSLSTCRSAVGVVTPRIGPRFYDAHLETMQACGHGACKLCRF